MKSPELGVGTEKGDKKGGETGLDSTLSEPDRGDTTHRLHPKNTPGHLHENVQNIGTRVTMVGGIRYKESGGTEKMGSLSGPTFVGPCRSLGILKKLGKEGWGTPSLPSPLFPSPSPEWQLTF